MQKGKFLETPLHAAARLSNTEIVNMLLEFGADVNTKNSEFERPVDVAVSSSLVEKILLLHEGKLLFFLCCCWVLDGSTKLKLLLFLSEKHIY